MLLQLSQRIYTNYYHTICYFLLKKKTILVYIFLYKVLLTLLVYKYIDHKVQEIAVAIWWIALLYNVHDNAFFTWLQMMFFQCLYHVKFIVHADIVFWSNQKSYDADIAYTSLLASQATPALNMQNDQTEFCFNTCRFKHRDLLPATIFAPLNFFLTVNVLPTKCSETFWAFHTKITTTCSCFNDILSF